MEPIDLISREELADTVFAIADIDIKLSRIIQLLEGGDDGEEWSPPDDA